MIMIITKKLAPNDDIPGIEVDAGNVYGGKSEKVSEK